MPLVIAKVDSNDTRQTREISPPGVSLRWLLWLPFALALVIAARIRKAFTSPEIDVEWRVPHSKVSSATVDGSVATLRNVRNLTFEHWSHKNDLPPTSFDAPYFFDTRVDLDSITDIYLGFTPCHVFMTFCLAPPTASEYITLSIEHRHDFVGAPKPSAWHYLSGRFVVYAGLCTESDILFRCIHRRGSPPPIVLFPIRDLRANANSEERRQIHRLTFLSMLGRVNELAKRPETYDYLTNSCATNTMILGNRAIAEVTRAYRRRALWMKGLLSYLIGREAGMQHLLHKNELIDHTRMDLAVDHASFADVHTYCNITPQLIHLVGKGVTGDSLSRHLRKRFKNAEKSTAMRES